LWFVSNCAQRRRNKKKENRFRWISTTPSLLSSPTPHPPFPPIWRQGIKVGEYKEWERGLVRWLSGLEHPTALPEVWSSNPSNHMMAHNHL